MCESAVCHLNELLNLTLIRHLWSMINAKITRSYGMLQLVIYSPVYMCCVLRVLTVEFGLSVFAKRTVEK